MPSTIVSSSRGDMVGSQREANEAETNASQRTGAATNVSRVPGRMYTFLARTSIRSR